MNILIVGQFQCNGALQAARQYHKNPREIASDVASVLSGHPLISAADVAGGGFLNITVSDRYLSEYVAPIDDERAEEFGVSRGISAGRISRSRFTSGIFVRRSSANRSSGSRGSSATMSRATCTLVTGDSRWGW